MFPRNPESGSRRIRQYFSDSISGNANAPSGIAPSRRTTPPFPDSRQVQNMHFISGVTRLRDKGLFSDGGLTFPARKMARLMTRNP
jgi:hypothetical protein